MADRDHLDPIPDPRGYLRTLGTTRGGSSDSGFRRGLSYLHDQNAWMVATFYGRQRSALKGRQYPVEAVEDWQVLSQLNDDPLFHKIDR